MQRELLGAGSSSGANMAEEFFIKSADLESKVRQLLPSQGGLGAGFDLSASTQIVPIVDLTESAEGSNVRADLQTALSLDSCTTFSVINATDTTLISNTGYFRVFGSMTSQTGGQAIQFKLTDGVTTKVILQFNVQSTSAVVVEQYDFVIFLTAGQSLTATSGSVNQKLVGVTRQIADIDGNLVNPA